MKKCGIVLFVIGLVLVGYLYFSLAHHSCPYCHGTLHLQAQIIKDGDTMFRYECENSPWHLVDSYFKY